MATTWTALTIADVARKITQPEIDALETFHVCAGQNSPITEAIAAVVSEVRGYIQGCAKNTLNDEADEIPIELSDAALAIVRSRIADRLPDCGIVITDGRHREYEDALRLLRDVASCRFGRFSGADADCATTTTTTSTGVISGSNSKACIGGDALIEF